MKNILYLIVSILTLSCKGPDKEVEYILIKHIPLDIPELLIGTPLAIASNSTEIVILDIGRSIFFHLIDIDQNRYLGSYGEKGEGPLEFIRPAQIEYKNDNTFYTYDPTFKRMMEIARSSDELIFTPIPPQDLLRFRYKFLTKYGTFVGVIGYGEGKFAILDPSGEVKGIFLEYPYKNEEEKEMPNTMRAMAYQGGFKMNPSGDKIVHAIRHAEMLFIYDVYEDSIKLRKEVTESYPEFKPDYPSEDGYSAIFHAGQPYAFRDLATTDNYIYALYSGKSLGEYGVNNVHCEYIYVYNWDGERIKTFKLDVPVISLCITPDDKIIYAAAANPDYELVKFEL